MILISYILGVPMDAQWSRLFGLSKLILDGGREVAIMITRGVEGKNAN